MKIISELPVVPGRSLTALIRISCLAHETAEVSDVRTTPSAGDWVLQPSPSLRDRDLRRDCAEDSGSLSFFLLPPDWWVFPLVSGIKSRAVPQVNSRVLLCFVVVAATLLLLICLPYLHLLVSGVNLCTVDLQLKSVLMSRSKPLLLVVSAILLTVC
jgi:hypothetical protein